MKKLVMSEGKDLWYLSANRQVFQFSLLLNAQPVHNVALWDFCLDGKGRPYLYLVTEGELRCYFWDGFTWQAQPLPLILDPTCIHTVFRAGVEQHFLVSVTGNKCLQHYLYKDGGWEKREVSFLAESDAILAFIPWGSDLALLSFAQAYTGGCLSLAVFDDSWKTKLTIAVGAAKFYSMVQGNTDLFLLFGEEKVTGGCLKIYKITYDEPGRFAEYSCNIQNGFGQPVVFLANDACRICWTERGKVYLASLDSLNYQVTDIISSSIFFPAEILAISGQGAGYLALSTIYGTKLEFPLVFKAEDFEKMARAHRLLIGAEDHPGLNHRFFSRAGHNSSPERQFCK